MNVQDRPIFIKTLTELAEAFGTTLSGVQINMYEVALHEYDLSDCTRAMLRWLKGAESIPVKTHAGGDQDYVATGRFFPKPAELIYLIEHPIQRATRPALPEAKVCPGCSCDVDELGPCENCRQKQKENLARLKALCDDIGTVRGQGLPPAQKWGDVQWEARLKHLGPKSVPKEWLRRTHPDEFRSVYPE